MRILPVRLAVVVLSALVASGCTVDIQLGLTPATESSGPVETASPTTGDGGTGEATGTTAQAPAPSCEDGMQNQDELGIDCGGTCPPCACIAGERRRCWIECVQDFPGGCIHAGAPLLMGVEACVAGVWGACAAPGSPTCDEMAEACPNGNELLATVECVDSSVILGNYDCLGQLGPDCDFSFFSGWAYSDCEEICLSPAETCEVEDEERACEVYCHTADGVKVPGMQDCRALCDALIWGPCLTNNGCLNPGSFDPDGVEKGRRR